MNISYSILFINDHSYLHILIDTEIIATDFRMFFFYETINLYYKPTEEPCTKGRNNRGFIQSFRKFGRVRCAPEINTVTKDLLVNIGVWPGRM